MSEDLILEIKGLKKYFPIRSGFFSRIRGFVKAVDGIDMRIKRGETTALVGESGCGKTTLGKTILKLLNPTEGKIFFQGIDITNLSSKQMRPIRKDMQMIFQNPYASLNPKMNVESLVTEGLVIHKTLRRKEGKKIAKELLELVGLDDSALSKYPHEFSGGQRQRIAIARALALKPSFVICDEPVSALDVSVQAQIINLLLSLRDRYNLTYLFISHDLRVVRQISHNLCVMYLGQIVEESKSENVYTAPLHPYTKTLLSSVPDIKKPRRKSSNWQVAEDIPNPINPPRGCRFHPRCPIAEDICSKIEPKLEEKLSKHYVACHLV